MAHLNCSIHRLKCLPLARDYFASGFRKILRFEFIAGKEVLVSEWAPLRGVHEVFFEEIIAQTQLLSLEKIEWLFSLIDTMPNDDLDTIISNSFPYPLSYSVSLALFHGYVQRNDFASIKPISLSTLILPTHTMDDVLACAKKNYGALKIKVNNVDDDSERIQAIRALIPKHIKIRLDANRKLTFSQAEKLLHALPFIQYLEEPSYEVDSLIELHKKSGVDLALDESFVDINDLSIFKKCGARYLILKPSRFTTIFAVMKLIERARSEKINVILSHCFESNFYAALIEKFAQMMQLHDQAHGIYSHIFSEDCA